MIVTHGLTDSTKGSLRLTVQKLRQRLLVDIAAEADRRYRFTIPTERAGLRAGVRHDREALEGIVARREASGLSRERVLAEMVAESASTLLHRLVLIRHMEATGILPLKLLTGGVRSTAYREAAEFLPELVGRPDDPSKGFGHLLALLYDELAADLPGLFGDVGTTRLFPVAGATLLTVIEDLDHADLEAAWADDTTTGWVYQFWNGAEKKRIDDKIGDGEGEGTGKGKVEAHEIAPKTALYTERYMVEWLLQNSLGAMWRAICRKRGWRCEADDALPRLEAMRKAGHVVIEDDAIDRWKYHVDVPLSDAFVDAAPQSIRNLRLLDPACGSGHFLVAAFDWLFAAWTAEAQVTGEEWTEAEIAAGIVENNLHGIDIDPPAVQLAAAAVYLKARQKGAHPRRLNLVASHFGLRWVTAEDRQAFAAQVAEATAVDPRVVETLLTGLTRADTLGSLLRVEEIDLELLPLLSTMPLTATAARGELDAGLFRQEGLRERVAAMVATKLSGLTRTDDLGVRLGAEQLAAGLRFTEMLVEGRYDVVVANPPYLTTQKLEPTLASWIPAADLYEAFVLRGCELARTRGRVAYVTLRGWMFLSQGLPLRRSLGEVHRLRAVADLHFGAFREEKDVSVAMLVAEPGQGGEDRCTFIRAIADLRSVVRDNGQPARNEAGLAVQPARWDVATRRFTGIAGQPLTYWWSDELLNSYIAAPKVGEIGTVTAGAQAAPLERFACQWWEVPPAKLYLRRLNGSATTRGAGHDFVPYIGGGESRTWFEPVTEVVRWSRNGLELKVWQEFKFGSVSKRVAGEGWYFRRGVTFTKIGSAFRARANRYESVFGDAGQTAFVPDWVATLAMMNSGAAREMLVSFNPTVNFQVGDVKRLAVMPVLGAATIVALLEECYSTHETRRETTVSFSAPGSSTWRSTQAWAQLAVDRPEDAPLPPFVPEEDPPEPKDFVSHALGICLGRFPGPAVPTRILFLATRGPDNRAAAKPLINAWALHFPSGDLHDYLREDFFTDDHLSRYDNRPIHWPLSSKNRNFVAWVCIHSFTDSTLDTLRAEHIKPCLDFLERQLADAPSAPPTNGKKGKDPVQGLRDLVTELSDFDRTIERVARHGPERDRQEVSAPYRMELEDGVRVNSACLYPLLAPQWPQPEQWWGEIAKATGKTAADWSKSAARHWPGRVDRQCRAEPSHAVAHGCFWAYHPERAWSWELRLQEEIGTGPDGSPFRIDEAASDSSRATFLVEKTGAAVAGLVKEAARRIGKRRKSGERPAPFELTFHEPGLWTREPLRLWNAELELIKRNKDEVWLRADDESGARAKLVKEHPDLMKAREKVLRKARKESDQVPLPVARRQDDAEEDEA